MRERFVKVKLLLDVPVVEATDEELREYLEFSVRYRDSIKASNPLAEYERPEAFEFEIIN